MMRFTSIPNPVHNVGGKLIESIVTVKLSIVPNLINAHFLIHDTGDGLRHYGVTYV